MTESTDLTKLFNKHYKVIEIPKHLMKDEPALSKRGYRLRNKKAIDNAIDSLLNESL